MIDVQIETYFTLLANKVAVLKNMLSWWFTVHFLLYKVSTQNTILGMSKNKITNKLYIEAILFVREFVMHL